jgi:hypothetical protein
LLALPFIKFIESGTSGLVITAIIVVVIFAAVAYMIKKSDVEAIVADIEEF